MARGVCDRGRAWWEACVARGHVWQGGHAWQRGRAWQRGMLGRGVCVAWGHAQKILRDTVNERAVRILLECILVAKNIVSNCCLHYCFALEFYSLFSAD